MEQFDSTQPLTLADGTQIDPTDGRVIVPMPYVEVPKPSELAERNAVSVRKLLVDLPAPPQQMNAISVVVAYSLFGLTIDDIATATGLPSQSIRNIMMTDAYNAMYQAVAEGIVRTEKDIVHNMLATASKTAATRMIQFVSHESAAVAMTAAKDVLDRSGHRPADVVEHKHKLEGGLTIEIIKRDDAKNIPTLDLTAEGEF